MSTGQQATHEKGAASLNGYGMLFVSLATLALGGAVVERLPVLGVPLLIAGIFVATGIYALQPRQGALMLLFGSYRGTDRSAGLRWANPFYRKTKISLRAHNLNSEKIKVNDRRGNPIEIGAAIVWRVEDTAKAKFEIEKYEEYVRIQSDAAIRHIAGSYAYDNSDESLDGKPVVTLREGLQEVSASLAIELQARFDRAGVVVEDARLTHLAYAPEIAGVMLRRQQAEAVIAARQKIVTGAVTMVEMALKGLSDRHLIELDDERKAAMVSNLLVVLCSEREAQPIINAGTLYT